MVAKSIAKMYTNIHKPTDYLAYSPYCNKYYISVCVFIQ